MNRVVRITNDGAELIDGFPKDIHHAAKGWPAHGNLNPLSEIVGFHTAHHAFDRLHGDGANAAFAEVLLDLRRHVQRFRYRVAFAGNVNGVVDSREMARLELNVHHRSDDLYDVPLTISIISLVMAACRTLFMCSVRASITSPAFLVADSIAVMRAACSAAEDSSIARRICVSIYRGSNLPRSCSTGCS